MATESNARFVVLVGDPGFVEGELEQISTPPLQTALHQNYPNPFNSEYVIRWDVAVAGRVELTIYDLAGALVKTVNAGVLSPGGYEFVWRGKDDRGRRAASGVYDFRLRAGDVVQTKRMTLRQIVAPGGAGSRCRFLGLRRIFRIVVQYGEAMLQDMEIGAG